MRFHFPQNTAVGEMSFAAGDADVSDKVGEMLRAAGYRPVGEEAPAQPEAAPAEVQPPSQEADAPKETAAAAEPAADKPASSNQRRAGGK